MNPSPLSAPERTEACPRFRVLCVDDDPATADATAWLLRAAGFEAVACYDGPTALDLAEELRPSVCILDLNMPGMDGDELAARLMTRPGWRPLTVVALTGMCDETSRLCLNAAGFDLHLVKPVDPGKLVSMVDELFRLEQSAQSLPDTGR